jgi:hypothetical integral membrane protein (TIGR02206 family)
MAYPNAIIAAAYPLLSAEHWAAMASIAVATTLLSTLLRRTAGRKHGATVQRWVCWTLAAVLLCGAVAAQVQRIAAHVWSLQESLPLHLCDIAVFVVVAALLRAGRYRPVTPASRDPWLQRLYEAGFIWGLGGTLQAVVTPDVPVRFPTFDCVRYFILHGGILVGVLVMTLGLRLRLQPGAAGRVWLTTVILALIVMPIDWVVGANYMYLCGPPANPTIYDLFGPWPWSLLTLLVVGTALMYLCYLPFWLLDRRARR